VRARVELFTEGFATVRDRPGSWWCSAPAYLLRDLRRKPSRYLDIRLSLRLSDQRTTFRGDTAQLARLRVACGIVGKDFGCRSDTRGHDECLDAEDTGEVSYSTSPFIGIDITLIPHQTVWCVMLSRYPLQTLRHWLDRCYEVAVTAERRVEQLNPLAGVRVIEDEIVRRLGTASGKSRENWKEDMT
jgi:hypothetical protein